ncbi:MAG: cell envelope integrity protein TolA [Cupriavidus sp.]|nr:MAG: cell envelope integrity protein TolA [Cupriavidus sp.]
MARFKADVLLKLDCDNLTQMKMDAAAQEDPERRKVMLGLISDRYDACRKKEEDKKKKEEAEQKKAEELAQKKAEEQRKKDEAEIKRQFDLEAKAEQKRVDEANKAREAAAAAQRARDMAAALGAEQAARDAAAKAGRQATWVDKIAAKVRPNVQTLTRPPKGTSCGLSVRILPDGSVQDVRVTRSCGIAGLDDAVVKAVWKSDPLPLPENPEDFDRNLNFTFYP